jgi:hypothetical protein
MRDLRNVDLTLSLCPPSLPIPELSLHLPIDISSNLDWLCTQWLSQIDGRTKALCNARLCYFFVPTLCIALTIVSIAMLMLFFPLPLLDLYFWCNPQGIKVKWSVDVPSFYAVRGLLLRSTLLI